MNKYLKKLAMAVLILTVFLSCSVTSAYADEYATLEYRFSFVNDSADEYGVSASPQQVEVLNSAFVRQNYASAPTLYWLCIPKADGSGANITANRATNVVHNVTTRGTYFFTYNTGYGGYLANFYLVGMPEAYDFDDYTVSGDWNA